MQILELELKDYKRLSLNAITYFKYNPKNKIQLILGTNGSGKSSIIKELSPLPADAVEYGKSGYKNITYDHEGDIYVLKSLFNISGNKFFFIKNDLELNPGGTISVYKELVKKHFFITQDIHGLMSGRIKFSRMSISDRRKWFTQISDCDYTYAINFYNKLKEQYRDIQGAFKLQQARLVQEHEKLLAPEEESKYKEDVKQLTIFLDYLLTQTNNISTVNNTIVDLENTNSDILKLKEDFQKYRKLFPNSEGFLSEEEIRNSLIAIKSHIRSNSVELEKTYESMTQQTNTINLLEQNNATSLRVVRDNIKTLIEERNSIKNKLTYDLKNKLLDNMSAALVSIRPQIDEYLTIIFRHTASGFSRESYKDCLEIIDNLNANKLSLQTSDSLLISKIKELEYAKTHNKINCPNCKHIWHMGFNELIYLNSKADRETIVVKLIELNSKLFILNNDKEVQTEYLTAISNFIKLLSSIDLLKDLWKRIIDSNSLRNNPKNIKIIISNFQLEITEWKKVNSFDDQISSLEAMLAATDSNALNDITSLKNNYLESENKVTKYMTEINNDVVIEKRLLRYLDTIVNMTKSAVLLQTLLEKQFNISSSIKKSARQEYISSCIRLVRSEINERSNMITRVDLQNSLIENMTKEVDSYEKQLYVYKITLKELSPTEGLIAKGLINFINHFVIQMNSFIKKIWLYPLEIQPIFQIDDDLELDYKFQLKINDDSLITDISLGSSAMREVIDLAFIIVSMKYLKLDKAPLFLDEFSINLDAAHRQSAFKTINELITNSNHSQVFMISHFENSYGSLKNADITILCPDNVIIPKNCLYNNCVVMT